MPARTARGAQPRNRNALSDLGHVEEALLRVVDAQHHLQAAADETFAAMERGKRTMREMRASWTALDEMRETLAALVSRTQMGAAA